MEGGEESGGEGGAGKQLVSEWETVCKRRELTILPHLYFGYGLLRFTGRDV